MIVGLIMQNDNSKTQVILIDFIRVCNLQLSATQAQNAIRKSRLKLNMMVASDQKCAWNDAKWMQQNILEKSTAGMIRVNAAP